MSKAQRYSLKIKFSSAVWYLKTTLVLGTLLSCYSQSTAQRATVVIDAGHGGHDHGAQGQYTSEKEIALDVTLAVGDLISTLNEDIEVIYTRVDDSFVPLDQRIGIANRHHADLFVSIHCNSISGVNASGSETYVMGLHRSADNLEVAKRENASVLLEDGYEESYADFDPYSIEGHILLSAIQNSHLKQSIEVAELVQREMSLSTTIRNRGVKQAGFLLLRKATMPSILIETAFLSDPENEKYIKSRKGKRSIAKGIAQGIVQYLNTSAAVAVTPVSARDKVEIVRPEAYKAPTTTSTTKSAALYSVQIASMKNPISAQSNHPINELNGIMIVVEDGLHKYRIGRYASISEASTAAKNMASNGHKGAFVVRYQAHHSIKL